MTPPSARSPITTHVLDTAAGRPARAVVVKLEVMDASGGGWTALATGATDADGRLTDLLPLGHPLQARTYRLTFDTGAYFRAAGRPVFYPRVEVTFEVSAPDEHHHVPLLLSPFGYSTYRGS
jgi:5-hydroxyisourate hydrolase